MVRCDFEHISRIIIRSPLWPVSSACRKDTGPKYLLTIKGDLPILDEVRGLDVEEFESSFGWLQSPDEGSFKPDPTIYCTSVNMFLNWIRSRRSLIQLKSNSPRTKTNARPYLPEEIEAVIRDQESVFKRGEKISDQYWNHLRAWMMMHLTGMRRSSLRLEILRHQTWLDQHPG